jgi:hypothetical protein
MTEQQNQQPNVDDKDLNVSGDIRGSSGTFHTLAEPKMAGQLTLQR